MEDPVFSFLFKYFTEHSRKKFVAFFHGSLVLLPECRTKTSGSPTPGFHCDLAAETHSCLSHWGIFFFFSVINCEILLFWCDGSATLNSVL